VATTTESAPEALSRVDSFLDSLRQSGLMTFLVSNSPAMHPACLFYMKLFSIFQNQAFKLTDAQKAIDFYDRHFNEISLRGVSLKNILAWYTIIRDGKGERILLVMTNGLFMDTAHAIGSDPRIPYFLLQWAKFARVNTPLLIHKHKTKPIGHGMAEVTLLVSDIEAFEHWYAHMQQSFPIA